MPSARTIVEIEALEEWFLFYVTKMSALQELSDCAAGVTRLDCLATPLNSVSIPSLSTIINTTAIS